MKGVNGSHQDYGMRMYDPRVGRFFSADPLKMQYVYYTPYQFAGNMPISATDLDGLEPQSQLARQYSSLNMAALKIMQNTGIDKKVNTNFMVVDQTLVGAATFGLSIIDGAINNINNMVYDPVKWAETQVSDPTPGIKKFCENYQNMTMVLAYDNAMHGDISRSVYNGNVARMGAMNAQIVLVAESAGQLLYAAVEFLPQAIIRPSVEPVVISEVGATEVNTTRGWQVGEPINNLTKAGRVPRWSTVRSRYWKNRAASAAPNEFTEANLARMRKGRAPQQYNARTGKYESKELHHIIPQRDGGLFEVQEVWPDEHAAIDPYRHTGNPVNTRNPPAGDPPAEDPPGTLPH